MLGSMSEKIAKEKERHDLYNQRIQQFDDEQKKKKDLLNIKSGRLIADQLTSRNETGRSQSTSRLIDSSRIETDRTITPTSRTLQPINEGTYNNNNTNMMSARDKTLLDFPVTSLKNLQSTHPEILAKLRAERAAKYVESLNNPLNPPEYDHVSARNAFRPGGGTLKYNNSGEFPELRVTQKKKSNNSNPSSSAGTARGAAGTSTEPLTTERIKDNLKSLVKILEETDHEIARQDLKIALAKKVPTYEKKGPKQTTNKTSARNG